MERNNDENIEKNVNIFFCSENNIQLFSELEKYLNNSTKNFIIKGNFNKSSIITEISYYLGICKKNNEEIDEKEINNIIIFNVSFNDAENILNSFIKEFNGMIQNDQYPFFVFFTDENNSNFDIKKIISDLNTFQLDIIKDAKLDSRNIYFDTKKTILPTITKIYNYYNGDFITELDNGEQDNYNYVLSKTLNILVIGKRGHGKSTLINRILGEKRAYAHPNANTPNTKIYYHKYYPIKFIDSAGFETGEISNINNIKDYLEKKNLVYKDIYKKIHFIFYVFRENDKFEDTIVKILQKLQTYKVEIFFIITNSTKGREIITKNYFKDTIKRKQIFPKDKINGIINNTFCLDLFDIDNLKTISDIFLLISGKLKEYEELNNIIIDSIKNYRDLVKTNEFGYIINDENIFENINNSFEDSNELISKNLKSSLRIIPEEPRGLIFNKNINDPNEILEIIKYNIKNNIFFTDFQNDRESKKQLSRELIQNFVWPGFWWSSIMIPFLNQYLSKKSKIKMIKKISEIYDIKVPDHYNDHFLDSMKKEDNLPTKFIKIIGTWIAGVWNKNDIVKIGEKVIEEFDCEYSKKNVLEVYYKMAEQYNKSFKMISNFYTCFNKDVWYDIKLEKNNIFKDLEYTKK